MNPLELPLDLSEEGDMVGAYVQLAPSAHAGAIDGAIVDVIVSASAGALVGSGLNTRTGSKGGRGGCSSKAAPRPTRAPQVRRNFSALGE